MTPDFDFDVCLFILLLQINMGHRYKVEEAFYNPSMNQPKRKNVSRMSIKSKERPNTSNQTKLKNLLPA